MKRFIKPKWLSIPIAAILIVALLLVVLPPRVSVTGSNGLVSIALAKDTLPIGEVVEMRTANSKTHYLGSGSYSLDSSIEVVHYREAPSNELEQWKDIDTTISKEGTVSTAPYDLEVHLTGLPGFHYTSKDSGEFDIRLREARVDSSSLVAVAPSVSKPVVKGNQVIWYDLYPDVDIIVTANNSGVTLQRLIKSPTAPLEYDVDIQVVEEGVAQLLNLKTATDANGQDIRMDERAIDGGRTETLVLEVIGEEQKPITYPILDATEINEYVSDGADDGYITRNLDYFHPTKTTLRVGVFSLGSNTLDAWYRFEGITIPQTSEVSTAYIETYEYNSQGAASTRIYAEDTNNPAAPTSRVDYLSKVTTTNSVEWDGDPGGAGFHQSPSIVSVIQELVTSYDYSNEAIQILHKADDLGGSYYQYFRTYDHSSDEGAKIHIEYEGGGEPDITNSPDTWNIGHVQANDIRYFSADNTQDDDYALITNTGGVAVDVQIQGLDIEGGSYDWTLGSSAGDQTYSLYANSEASPTVYDIEVKKADYSYLCEDLAVDGTYNWSMKFTAPTALNPADDGLQKSTTITLVAIAAD